MTFFDQLGEALLEIRLRDELREMHRQGIAEGAHPIDRQRLDRAPRTERSRIKFLGEAHKMRRLAVEMATQFLGVAELLILQQTLRPDVAERSRQLIMMRVAARQTVIVDKYLQLAFAQGGAVEVRQIVDRRARSVHRRLINQMDPAKKRRVACNGVIQSSQISEKRHPRRPVLLDQAFYRAPELIDWIRQCFDPITLLRALTAGNRHIIVLSNKFFGSNN